MHFNLELIVFVVLLLSFLNALLILYCICFNVVLFYSPGVFFVKCCEKATFKVALQNKVIIINYFKNKIKNTPAT